MYASMHAWMHGCMDAWMYGCMDVCMYVMYVYLRVCVYACTDVYMYRDVKHTNACWPGIWVLGLASESRMQPKPETAACDYGAHGTLNPKP